MVCGVVRKNVCGRVRSQLNFYGCEKYFVFIFNSTLLFKQRFMCRSDDVDGKETATQSHIEESLVHHPWPHSHTLVESFALLRRSLSRSFPFSFKPGHHSLSLHYQKKSISKKYLYENRTKALHAH